jgi:hypothetical protein
MSKTFEVEGSTYEFLSDDDLTFGEMCVIERTTGIRFNDEDGRGSAEFIKAMVWVSMKRKDPTLTYGDVDDVPVKVLLSLADDEAEAEPEAPKDEAPEPVADVPALSSVGSAI